MGVRRRRIAEGPTSPDLPDGLADDLETGKGDQAESLPARLARYARAKDRALAMRDYLRSLCDAAATRAADLLGDCGNYLNFRHYYTVGRVLLYAACFCKQHLICPLCAIRRGSKTLEAYLERYQAVCQQYPALRPYLLTLTIKDGPDLDERFRHLTQSFQVLKNRRRFILGNVRSAMWTEFAKVEGAVGSYEVKRGKNSGGWHPHIHMVVLCEKPIDPVALKREWESITRDSFMIDVRPFREDQEPAEGFMEVFKYAVKFGDLSLPDNWEVARYLFNARLLFSLGVFRGVKVPESLTDEPLDSLPYFDLFYRYFVGIGYTMTGECHPARELIELPDYGLSRKDTGVLLSYRQRRSSEPQECSKTASSAVLEPPKIPSAVRDKIQRAIHMRPPLYRCAVSSEDLEGD
ncbi:MAG: protein rep [Nitrosomonas ureae]